MQIKETTESMEGSVGEWTPPSTNHRR